jgi:U3 small nucleolar RNA-associated protein 23
MEKIVNKLLCSIPVGSLHKMRITRHKSLKKSLRFFKAAFDYVDPFHVIIDPAFIELTVQYKIRLKEDLTNMLSGRVTPMVTECIMCHLRRNGRAKTDALLMGKSCYRLKCGHDGKNPLSPAECVLAQLENENPRHFLVATQEDDLKGKARVIPGTPVLSIHGSLLMLESPSNESREAAEHRELKRKRPKLSENTESDDYDESETETADPKKSRKKKRKGANPLSCKKKQVKPIVTQSPSEGKKKRIRSKRKTPSSILTQESMSLE